MNRRRLGPAPFVVVLAIGSFLNCGKGPTDVQNEPRNPTGISLNVQVLQLFDTETFQVQATLRDKDGQVVTGTISWASDDPTVATVVGGLVEGVSRGTTTIEASHQNLSSSITVSVVDRLGLEWPLAATVNQDVYFTNYVDLDPGTGIEDYQCGPRSYDGHAGIDIALTSFAVMDSGVTVVASAPGRVVTAVDGMYDRNHVWQGGGLGNHVEIEHRDGMVTRYGHMVNGSVAVAVGDYVMAGTPLGLVGSSGNSDGPHLHFELRRSGLILDPYAGQCGNMASQWANQLTYQNVLRFIDAGVVSWEPTLDQAKDGLPHLDTLMASDPRATLWVQLHNLHLGAQSRWILRSPSGIYGQFVFTHDQFYMMSWWWAWWTMPNGFPETGTWKFEYYHDNQLMAEREFVVRPTTALRTDAGPGSGAAESGGGGGGMGHGRP